MSFFLSDYNFDRRATFNSFGGDMRVDFTASYYIFVQKLIDAAFWGEKKQDCGLKNYCNNIPFLFSKIHIEAAVYLLYRLHPFAEFSHAVINILRATGIYNGHFSIESHYTWERGLKLYEPVSSTTYSQFHFDSLTPPKGLSIDDTITDYLKSIEIYYTGLEDNIEIQCLNGEFGSIWRKPIEKDYIEAEKWCKNQLKWLQDANY